MTIVMERNAIVLITFSANQSEKRNCFFKMELANSVF